MSGDGNVTSQPKFDPEMMYRTYLRLKKILNSSPAAFSPVLKFPEVFILIVVCTTRRP